MGLHQWQSEKNGQGVRLTASPSLLHRPPQKPRLWPTGPRSNTETDSLLEWGWIRTIGSASKKGNAFTGSAGEQSETCGTLKNWLHSYGFIKPDELGADLFVHAKDLGLAYAGQPGPGLRLAFDVVAGRGGRDRAINIELTE